MADLHVSGAVLDELRGSLKTMTAKLEAACQELRGVDSGAMGAQPLVDGIGDFTSGWNYGITQIGQHSTQAASMLDQIGKAFDQADQKLTSELTGSKK